MEKRCPVCRKSQMEVTLLRTRQLLIESPNSLEHRSEMKWGWCGQLVPQHKHDRINAAALCAERLIGRPRTIPEDFAIAIANLLLAYERRVHLSLNLLTQ